MPEKLQQINYLAFHSPQWRCDRARQMVDHTQQQSPAAWDDQFVRTYSTVLLRLAAAGNDAERREAVFREFPAACQAHLIRNSPDVELSQILEAYVLTNLPAAEIAKRMSLTPTVVEHFEKIFFDVRQRLGHSCWINITVQILRRRENEARGVAAANRGYVLRQFGYSGGAAVLEALVSGIASPGRPERSNETDDWFVNVLNPVVVSKAAEATASLEMNEKNMLKHMKLAVRQQKKSGRDSADEPTISKADLERGYAKFVDTMEKAMSPPNDK